MNYYRSVMSYLDDLRARLFHTGCYYNDADLPLAPTMHPEAGYVVSIAPARVGGLTYHKPPTPTIHVAPPCRRRPPLPPKIVRFRILAPEVQVPRRKRLPGAVLAAGIAINPCDVIIRRNQLRRV